jgi:hypothetical protein
MSFEVKLGGATIGIDGDDTGSPDRIDDRLGLADSAAWKALLKPERFVRSHSFDDPSNLSILSYDAVGLASLLEQLYSDLARSAGGDLPLISDILDRREWGTLVRAIGRLDKASADPHTGLRDPNRQFARLRRILTRSEGIIDALEKFQLFHTPPNQGEVRAEHRTDDPRIAAQWREHTRTPLPTSGDLNKELDFHQIVAALGAYPVLQRRFGLVVDLLIRRTAFPATADGALSVAVTLPPGVQTASQHASPVTRVELDATRFRAIPKPGASPRIKDGLLDLDPTEFRLLQIDTDGAGLKLMNFARSILRLSDSDDGIDPTTRYEDRVGAPALRTAGLVLVQRQRSATLKERLNASAAQNASVEAELGGAVAPTTLYAEDLTRGYRFDVWDSATTRWQSLCRRMARYELSGGAVIVEPAEEEETIVRLAATSGTDGSRPDMVYLHEAVMSWAGWSLAAPPPGRAVLPDDGLDASTSSTEPGVPAGLGFRPTFRAVKGSLPRLRFGRRYSLRARAVDLAGNSLSHDVANIGADDPLARSAPFRRLEPLEPPVIALLSQGGHFDPPGAGESVSTVAIRSFNNAEQHAQVVTDDVARRAVVPPRVSVRDAELHGALDKDGKVDASTFAMLAHSKDVPPQDPGAAIRLVTPATGDGSPSDTTAAFAVYEAGRTLTYLPDPLALAVAARVFDHPGISDGEIIQIPLYPDGSWPEARPFEIEIYEDPAGPFMFDGQTRRLRVPLPKGVQARLRLSMVLAPESLPLMAINGFMKSADQAAQRDRILAGQHWMLTPWRTVRLVHAVQRPLLSPELVSVTVERDLDSTSVRPAILARCSIGTTDRLDLLAEWHDPADAPGPDGTAPPSDRPNRDVAFNVKLTDPKHYATRLEGHPSGGYPEHLIAGADLISVNLGGGLHRFVPEKIQEFHDPRYRQVTYRFIATSRFREFMPQALFGGGDDASSDPEAIKREGSATVTWVPNAAPPPAPSVLYVVPTFGWTRQIDGDGVFRSERRGGGIRVWLDRGWNASGYGEMLAVVLPPTNFTGDPASEPPGAPLKTYVTQWGNDPIWKSPFVPGIAPRRADFTRARTAPDPDGAWLPPGAPRSEAHQPPGPFRVTNLRPARVSAAVSVEIAPHDVHFDTERGLWFCDIEIDPARAYWPFIRLALARYQPVSVDGAHLSPVVLGDIVALSPHRWLSIRNDGDGIFHVLLTGVVPDDTSSHYEASRAPSMSLITPLEGKTDHLQPASMAQSTVLDIGVEVLDRRLGEDFGWGPLPDVVVQTDEVLPDEANPSGGAGTRGTLVQWAAAGLALAPQSTRLWSGTIRLPPGSGRRLRLVIAEFEEYLVDDDHPYDKVPTRKDRRLVYLEHVPVED